MSTIMKTGRSPGHIKPHESRTDWEVTWVKHYASDGFGSRHIAAMVYGLRPGEVTDTEMNRVRDIAKDQGVGINAYRTMSTEHALHRVQQISGLTRKVGFTAPVVRAWLRRQVDEHNKNLVQVKAEKKRRRRAI